MKIVIRHAEPEDYKALHKIFSGPRVIEDTLQLPLPSAEMWRKRISEKPEGVYALVACVEGEVVGDLTLETHPTRWRRRHAAREVGDQRRVHVRRGRGKGLQRRSRHPRPGAGFGRRRLPERRRAGKRGLPREQRPQGQRGHQAESQPGRRLGPHARHRVGVHVLAVSEGEACAELDGGVGCPHGRRHSRDPRVDAAR